MSHPTALARCLAALTAGGLIALGLYAIMQDVWPGRWTKAGYAPALYGPDAQNMGRILLLLGCLPLLLFCRNAKSASILGCYLGLALMVAIFVPIYL